MELIRKVSDDLRDNLTRLSHKEKFNDGFKPPILRLNVRWSLGDSPRKNHTSEGAFRVELKATHYINSYRNEYRVTDWRDPLITIIQGGDVNQRAQKAIAETFHHLAYRIYGKFLDHDEDGGLLLEMDNDRNWYSPEMRGNRMSGNTTFQIEKEVKAGCGLMKMTAHVGFFKTLEVDDQPDESENDFEL